MLPFAIDEGRWGLSRSKNNRLRLSLLLGSRRTKVNATIVSSHQKLIRVQLSYQCTAYRLGIPLRGPASISTIGNNRIPCP